MRFIIVFGFLCVNLAVGRENVYRAAIVGSKDNFKSYPAIIKEASKLNVDILLLPSDETPVDSGKYDEVTKSLSTAAKETGLYVVSHLHEKTLCQNKDEVVRSSLVFDREGAIVASYRKPLNNAANCSVTSQIPTFTTAFGVRFSLLMNEDLVLSRPGLSVKNAVVAGASTDGGLFLSEPQFSSSWAYVTNANLVTSSGIFAGRDGVRTGAGNIIVAELSKDGGADHSGLLTVNPSKLNMPGEDLSQYTIRQLDLEDSIKGYTETVCHGKFCCDFYVKTSYYGSSHNEVSYGLAVFDGTRHYSRGHHIGSQTCSIVACAGLYKRTCSLQPNNSTNMYFEKVTISGNFSSKTAQFPIILSTSATHNINFNTQTINSSNRVTIAVENGKNLLKFGIFGRDYSKDFERDYVQQDNTDYSENFYDYFFDEDLQEFFDYLWIRFRILFVIVSIYVLEMM